MLLFMLCLWAGDGLVFSSPELGVTVTLPAEFVAMPIKEDGIMIGRAQLPPRRALVVMARKERPLNQKPDDDEARFRYGLAHQFKSFEIETMERVTLSDAVALRFVVTGDTGGQKLYSETWMYDVYATRYVITYTTKIERRGEAQPHIRSIMMSFRMQGVKAPPRGYLLPNF